MTVLADTGAVYALLDQDDHWHQRVIQYWEHHASSIRLPEPILAEICYLVGSRLGPEAEQAFVQAIVDGEFALEPFQAEDDLVRAVDLMQTYRSAKIGFVDAAIVAAAERLDVKELLTTDRRHFGLIRPAHRSTLTLVP